MAEDWRLKVELDRDNEGEQLVRELHGSQLEGDVHDRLGQRIVVSNDGPEVFLYMDSEEAAREAEQVVSSIASEQGWQARTSLARWHDVAEEWEDPNEPLPESADAVAREHAERIEEEREDTAEEGYAQWEVRVELPSRHDAGELSKRLESEGVPHVRRWRYVAVGAADEDTAREWEARLRSEVPSGATVTVDGTFASVERHNPFAVWGVFGVGGP